MSKTIKPFIFEDEGKASFMSVAWDGGVEFTPHPYGYITVFKPKEFTFQTEETQWINIGKKGLFAPVDWHGQIIPEQIAQCVGCSFEVGIVSQRYVVTWRHLSYTLKT